MRISDQEIGKKEEERSHFAWFSEAYAYSTELELTEEATGERPDFICSRSDGLLVGVELTAVRLSPEERFVAGTLRCEEFGIHPDDALARCYAATASKDSKRRDPDWKLPDSSILVLLLMDTDPDCFEEHATDLHLAEDFAEFGFMEIWAANLTTIDPWGSVTLFGLYPSRIWGPHEPFRCSWKPYG